MPASTCIWDAIAASSRTSRSSAHETSARTLFHREKHHREVVVEQGAETEILLLLDASTDKLTVAVRAMSAPEVCTPSSKPHVATFAAKRTPLDCVALEPLTFSLLNRSENDEHPFPGPQPHRARPP